jgi:transcriptional regulator, XRE family
MQKFSQRLISLRKERDLTQNDLARIIKKQRTTVSGYETMDKEPDFEVLCALAEYFGVTTDYLLGRDDERAHADVVFRNDNANFKRQYDRLPPELKAIITSTFDSFYVMLSRAMSAQRTDELTLYRDLIEVLQRDRSAVKRLLGDNPGDLATIFPQLMERQNGLKAETAAIIDSLLQADIAAENKK